MNNSDKQLVKRILIIKLSSLGDVIHALPVPEALRRVYPLADISFLVNREYGELLRGNLWIDEIFLFERNMKGGFFKGVSLNFKLLKVLRSKGFDLVIDLQGLLRSGLIAWFSRSKNVVGFENAREGSRFFYSQRIPVPDQNIHAVDRYLLIPKSMGWNGNPHFYINLHKEDELFIEEFIRAEKLKTFLPIIAIQPMARWPTKEWSPAKFAELGNLIQKSKEYQVVFLGSKEEVSRIEVIVRLMDEPPVTATGKLSLKQLAAFLKKSTLLITNDSGPMHLAVALNIPVLALFGATDFRRTGPYQMEDHVIYKSVACRPCLKRSCLNHAFPMECMERITPEEVFERIKEMEKNR
jgi:heptosyltransferase-1